MVFARASEKQRVFNIIEYSKGARTLCEETIVFLDVDCGVDCGVDWASTGRRLWRPLGVGCGHEQCVHLARTGYPRSPTADPRSAPPDPRPPTAAPDLRPSNLDTPGPRRPGGSTSPRVPVCAKIKPPAHPRVQCCAEKTKRPPCMATRWAIAAASAVALLGVRNKSPALRNALLPMIHFFCQH